MALIGYGLPKRSTETLGDTRGHDSSLLTTAKPSTAEPVSLPSDIASVVSFDADKDVLIVVCADGSERAREGGTLAWRNCNPGNLKFGPFAKEHGAIAAGEGGHAVFPNYQTGRYAQHELVFTMKRNYAAMTITEMLSHYAPVSDKNDPITYANYVAKKTGVSPGTDLKDLTEVQRVRFLDAMQAMEGYKEGKEIIL